MVADEYFEGIRPRMNDNEIPFAFLFGVDRNSLVAFSDVFFLAQMDDNPRTFLYYE